MVDINCSGLACPAPVLKTKDFLDRENPVKLEIMVDNVAAAENVSRFLTYRGYEVETEKADTDFIVRAVRNSAGSSGSIETERVSEEPLKETKKIVVVAATDRFGSGDDMLGSALMTNFLSTLREMGSELWRLIFVNSGVKLTIEGSKTLSTIQELEESGVKVMVCGTCLTHFNLLEKKKVGETTNMLDIVTSMQVADKVINLS